MMITKKQIVEYYDTCEIDYKNNWHLDKCLAIHIGYWDKATKNLPEALERQNEVMAEKAKIKQKDIVLDMGCGVGGSSIFLAKKYGCKVFGITLSKNQVVSALNFSKINNVENLTRFQIMDFTKTAFSNSIFDVIWALESSCYADSKRTFIKEAYRLLKKNGRLIVADGFESKAKYKSYERELLDKWIKRWAVNSLESIKSFGSYLKEAGFTNIVFEDITKNVTHSSRMLFYRSLIAVPFAIISEVKGTRNKIQNDNLFGAIYQYLSLKKKLAKYGIFYAEKQ